jgi:DNA-binding GntR family transcriptional regulator
VTVFEKESRTTLKVLALEQIKKAIFCGELKPGDRVVETELADAMGISRFPIREAIRHLEEDGIVVSVPFKGVYVPELSLEDLKEIYLIRGALEDLALTILMEKINAEDINKLEAVVKDMEHKSRQEGANVISEDMRFHRTICELSGYPRLLKMWLTLHDQIMLSIALERQSYDNWDSLIQTHYPLMEALKQRDAKLARERLREHLWDAFEVVKRVVGNKSVNRRDA